MIVKNEEVLLSRCLESVKDADEIVICDTGSTDRTIEIAKQYTDKVFTDYVWNDNFGEAYTHAFNKCTGDWILSIDADGVLEEGGIAKIRKVIEKIDNDKSYDAIYYEIWRSGKCHHTLPRICRRGTKWYYRVHSNPLVKKQYPSDVRIFADDSPAHKKDPERALRMLLLQRKKMPEDKRTIYYLAREYWYKGDYETANKIFQEYIKTGGSWRGELADAYLHSARCLWYLQRGDDAREQCGHAIMVNPDFKEALLFMADMYYEPMKSTWLKFAKIADNKNVLFIRVAHTPDPYNHKDRQKNTYYSAKKIMEIIKEKMGDIRSVVDLGCGVGTWLKVTKDIVNHDITILGIDKGIPEELLVIPKSQYKDVDLSKDIKNINPFIIFKNTFTYKFDLAISLEVAEHLPEVVSDDLVDKLTSMSDNVLFSAATVGQGGVGHINEQPVEYWINKFAKRNFYPVTLSGIKDDKNILSWYRNNILFFQKKKILETIK